MSLMITIVFLLSTVAIIGPISAAEGDSLSFDADVYGSDGTANITVDYAAANSNSETPDTIEVLLSSPTAESDQTVTATEDGADSGVFEASIAFGTDIEVSLGDTVTATYTDDKGTTEDTDDVVLSDTAFIMGMEFDKDFYSTGELAEITVYTSSDMGESIYVTMSSDLANHSTTIIADKMADQTYVGDVKLVNTVTSAEELIVIDGDTISASFDYNDDGSDETITATVDETAPVISNETPTEDQTIGTPTITADYTDGYTDGGNSGVDTSGITLLLDGEDITSSATAGGSSVTFTPAEALEDGEYTVELTVPDNAGNVATLSWSFMVDTVSPAVEVDISPSPCNTSTDTGTIEFVLTFDEDMYTETEGLSVTFGDGHEVTGNWTTFRKWEGTFDTSSWSGTDGEKILTVSGAQDVAGNVMEDETSTFYLDLTAPDAPTLTSPADGSVSADEAKPSFEWSPVTDDSGVSYVIEISTDETFATEPYILEEVTGTSFTPSEALPNDEFFWRVKAVDGAENESGWSDVWSVEIDAFPPEVTVISPNGGESLDGTAGSLFVVEWQASDNITAAEDLSFEVILDRGMGYETSTIDLGSLLGTADATPLVLADDGDADDTDTEDEYFVLEEGVFKLAVELDADYNNANCRVKVTVADAKGNESFDESDADFSLGTPQTCDISLGRGWNLISVPYLMEDESIEAVLGDISENVAVVQYFDANMQSWLTYAPGNDSSTLTTIEDGKGYWIYMDEADTLTVTGSQQPPAGQTPPTYDVVEGWNLIGIRSNSSLLAEVYLGSLNENYSVVWEYDYLSGYNAIYPDPGSGEMMDLGEGFWLWATEDGTIVPPTVDETPT